MIITLVIFNLIFYQEFGHFFNICIKFIAFYLNEKMKKMLKNNVACSSKLFFYFIIIFFVFDILSSICFSWKHSNIPLFFHLNLKNSFLLCPFVVRQVLSFRRQGCAKIVCFVGNFISRRGSTMAPLPCMLFWHPSVKELVVGPRGIR